METTHERLHLYKCSVVQWKAMDIPTSSTWIVTLFEKAIK
jgi:hypothetical protein